MDAAHHLVVLAGALERLSIFAGLFWACFGTLLPLVLLAIGIPFGKEGHVGLVFNDFRTAYLIGSGPRGNPVRDGLKTNFLLKIIPHVDGSSRICKLVEYHLEDIELKGAWTGPGALDLHAHALPLSPSCGARVISATHIIADLTWLSARPSTTICDSQPSDRFKLRR